MLTSEVETSNARRQSISASQILVPCICWPCSWSDFVFCPWALQRSCCPNGWTTRTTRDCRSQWDGLPWRFSGWARRWSALGFGRGLQRPNALPGRRRSLGSRSAQAAPISAAPTGLSGIEPG